MTALSRSWSERLITLELEDGSSIQSTSEHPYWVAELDDWVAAQDLIPGQHLLTVDGDVRQVEEVFGESGVHEVFNFTVEESHNYFAGDAGVLVHNGGPLSLTTLVAIADYNQAFNQALDWLEARGFKAETQTIGKFGPNAGKGIGMQTMDGKVGFRVEFDARSKAHINVWAGKEKGPHFKFEGTPKTVNKIVRRFKCP